jgi:hypothetical protein
MEELEKRNYTPQLSVFKFGVARLVGSLNKSSARCVERSINLDLYRLGIQLDYVLG